jgi:hypothetical protein
MKRYIYSLLVVAMLLFGYNKFYNPFKIRPFKIVEMNFLNKYYTFTNSGVKTYSRKFLVSGFKYNDTIQERLIDAYVCNITDSLGFENCSLAFYKESQYTNIAYLLDYPKGIYRESSYDLVIQYSFTKNKFDNKMLTLYDKKRLVDSKILNELICPK